MLDRYKYCLTVTHMGAACGENCMLSLLDDTDFRTDIYTSGTGKSIRVTHMPTGYTAERTLEGSSFLVNISLRAELMEKRELNDRTNTTSAT